MLVSSYNRQGLNDVLVIMLASSNQSEQTYQRSNDVVEIKNTQNDTVVGYNFFNISDTINIEGNGQVMLNDGQVDRLNQLIIEAGFSQTLEADASPKFVVGFVKECRPHKDSDHLNITQIDIGRGDVCQIVCGASNIAQGQRVVVAKPGAIMPNGQVIWPGELRGVDSHGMICSAKELTIESSQTKGILVLDESYVIGSQFKL